ncbi:hypothetical protein [Emticicia agri]|uniref:Uncharacterized protein n=1 Tax=Emticicia agri TaxID=2492393 RepID=A0A4Q5LX00_9BACT|nr:hypothetical protein [Emticicia agri]RYU94341.1 hypothetical protein EWM59_17605 [Emticicia agri]
MEFYEYFIGDEALALAKEFKKYFKGFKGKRMKILILILQEDGKLRPLERQFKEFYKVMQDFCDWSIGSRQAINDVKKEHIREEEFEEIRTLLNSVYANL